MKKSTILLITLAFIVLGVVLGFLLWPKQFTVKNPPVNNQTIKGQNSITQVAIDSMDLVVSKKGWRIYQNSAFNFLVEVPEGWTILEVPEFNRVQFYSDGILRDANNEYAYMDDAGPMTVWYKLEENPKDDWYEKEAEKKESIIINNYSALKYINVTGGAERKLSSILFDITVFIHNSSRYLVSFSTSRYSTEERKLMPTLEEGLFDQILASFKFID